MIRDFRLGCACAHKFPPQIHFQIRQTRYKTAIVFLCSLRHGEQTNNKHVHDNNLLLLSTLLLANYLPFCMPFCNFARASCVARFNVKAFLGNFEMYFSQKRSMRGFGLPIQWIPFGFFVRRVAKNDLSSCLKKRCIHLLQRSSRSFSKLNISSSLTGPTCCKCIKFSGNLT